MVRVIRVRMDYLDNPVGVTCVPQISWEIISNMKNVLQKTYQVQAAKDITFTKMVFDSGEVKGEESAHVKLEGLKLESLQKYYLRVKISVNQGETSDWSEPGFFVTALVENEWKASFISAETEKDADNSKGTYLRKEFEVKGKVEKAFVCTTALGLYKFYINGEKIGTDELTPGWTSYNKHLLYQTYDITEYLQEGSNACGAMLGAGWYKGKMGFAGLRNHYGKQTAFLCQMHITYEDGTTSEVISDDTWKGMDAPVLFSEIYAGETYDANCEIAGWNKPGLPAADWRRINEVVFDKSVLEAQGGCKVSEIEEIQGKRIFRTPKGDMVIDFGQNLTGWVHFKVQGKAGDIVALKCFEVLDAEGNVYLDNLRTAEQRILYTLGSDKEEKYHPNFTFQGFQFVKVVQYPGTPKLEDFSAFAVHSDMGQTGFFECSNQELNQLQHNILWGLKGNFVDIPTDCPQRDERLGWTGDAQIFCRTASFLMNTYNFMRKWLKDVAADQTPEGGVPHVVPDILSGNTEDDWLMSQGSHSAAAWADVAVINPWTVYQTFGDKKILEEQYASMKGWIDFMRTHAEDYIWNYKLQFGDWVALDAEEGSYFGATPNDLTCTAYFAYSTGLFVKIAKVLNRIEDYEYYSNLYCKIVDKFQSTFFDTEGNMTAQTQTAHIVALYFRLVPEKYREKIIQNLVKLLEKENGHLVTGFVGTPYFCHALSENGCMKEAYELLMKDDFPSWLYQVKKGATTVWEHWDGLKPDGTMWSPDMNSFNHYAYGAIGEWLYRVVAGIEIDEDMPGYKHTIIQPHVGGNLTYVKGEYDSVYGAVKTHWQAAGREVILEVEIPANTTATIKLEQAKKVTAMEELQFELIEDVWTAKTGSGHYVIQYEM